VAVAGVPVPDLAAAPAVTVTILAIAGGVISMTVEELAKRDAREPYQENIDELLQITAEAQALEVQ
jgi:hypothetical protein